MAKREGSSLKDLMDYVKMIGKRLNVAIAPSVIKELAGDGIQHLEGRYWKPRHRIIVLLDRTRKTGEIPAGYKPSRYR